MTSMAASGFPAVNGAADQIELRRDIAGLITHHADGSIRTGILPAHTGALVTARSDMGVDVAPFCGVTERDAGAILMANPGTVNVPIPAGAPSSGTSRIDIAYFKQNEQALHAEDDDDLPVIEVLTGAESGLPVAPDLSTIPGAVELAQVLIPSTASATNSPGVVITPTYRFTATTGGVVLVRDHDELEAYDAPDGALANRLDSADVWRRISGAWRNGDVPEHGSCIRNDPQTIPNNVWTPIVFQEPGPLQGFTYSSSGVTALEAGSYLYSMKAVFLPNSSGYRAFQMHVNGAVAEPSPIGQTKLANGAAHSTALDESGFIDLDAGDAITFQMHQTSGGNLNTNYAVVLRFIRLSDRRLFTTA